MPPEKLQDKSDRPFFSETLNAAPNAAVFSPLELTQEHGQIVVPFRPVVRVSGQIVGPDGKPRALLVLNYQGKTLLREFKQDGNGPREDLLLNSDGYWLVGPNPGTEWDFQFPERKVTSLKEQDPEIWKKISTNKSGSFDENGSLYCYQNIDPVGSTTDYPPLRMPVKGGERLHWTLLTKVPNATIWKDVKGIRQSIWVAGSGAIALLVPLIAIGSFSAAEAGIWIFRRFGRPARFWTASSVPPCMVLPS